MTRVREIAAEVSAWLARGERFALCTIVDTSGSSPRPVGTSMAVHVGGEVVGSLSGGCVEGAVYEAASDVLAGGAPRVEEYGYSDDTAFAVGLTCGGRLSVLVAEATGDPALSAILDALARDEPAVLVTALPGPGWGAARLAVTAATSEGTLRLGPALDSTAIADARARLVTGGTGRRTYGPEGQRMDDDVTVLTQSFVAPPRMLVFGAIDFAEAVTRLGSFLGYRVTVCDARPVFATPKRFPAADEVVCEWPHRYLARTPVDARTVVCVLTHDPKFDVPLLEVALRSPAGYVGAMGSRRTHTERLERLRAAGLTDSELSRLRSPIGLDLGAATPEQTAVAIGAEIIKDQWGASALPLGQLDTPIHRAAGATLLP